MITPRYMLLKDISHPFYEIKKGTIKTLAEWLYTFNADWILLFTEKIEDNPEWFRGV